MEQATWREQFDLAVQLREDQSEKNEEMTKVTETNFVNLQRGLIKAHASIWDHSWGIGDTSNPSWSAQVKTHYQQENHRNIWFCMPENVTSIIWIRSSEQMKGI